MSFYDCPYVVVVPFRHGNEYAETYICDVTRTPCQCCQCTLSEEDCKRISAEQRKEKKDDKRKDD